MKALWLFATLTVASCTAPASAEEEKEKEPCADINGLRTCEVPPPPDSVIKLLPELTDSPSHLFFSTEI